MSWERDLLVLGAIVLPLDYWNEWTIYRCCDIKIEARDVFSQDRNMITCRRFVQGGVWWMLIIAWTWLSTP
jgi:hypothetical protein